MTRSLLVASVLVFACRSSNPGTTDAPGGGGGGGGVDAPMIDAPAGSGCTTYTTTTIASMRMAQTYGCYELDNVVMTAATSVGSAATSIPKLFVEDSGAGAYSAIELSCSTTSTTHPCTTATAASIKTIGAGPAFETVTVKGTYTHANSGFEAFYPDTVTDGGAGTAISPAAATLADVERSGSNTGLRFQHVTAPLNGTTLVAYDWSPSEFMFSSGTCTQDGFALIGSGVATSGPACAGSAMQPASAGANPSEILIDTIFYHKFFASSDCACNGSSYADTISGSSTVPGSGSIGGMLLFETEQGTGSGYYYLAPTGSADANITNLIIP